MADSADSAWRKAVQVVLNDPEATEVPSRGGDARELLHATLEIKNPRRRWVASRTPALNVAFALAEVVWIVGGRCDVQFLEHWNSQYPKFVGTKGHAHAAYGMRLRRRFKIDQLSRAYRVLEHNPDSRQVVLDIWSAADDFPFETGRPRAGDIPCNVSACLRLKAGHLEWMQVLRSNDLFLGFPHNIVQFTYLQEILAGWLGVQPGRYTHVVNSLHAYAHHRGQFDLRVRPPRIPPSLDARLPFQESQRGWNELERLCVMMVRRGSRGLAGSLPQSAGLPPALNAMYTVMAAEHCRRAGAAVRAERFIANCADPALIVMWENWMALRKRPARTAAIHTGSCG